MLFFFFNFGWKKVHSSQLFLILALDCNFEMDFAGIGKSIFSISLSLSALHRCSLCFSTPFILYIYVFTGERRTVVSCMRIANKSMEVVNNSHCHPENQPHPQVRLCNTHPCQYRWDPDVWPYFSSIDFTAQDHYFVGIATTLEKTTRHGIIL